MSRGMDSDSSDSSSSLMMGVVVFSSFSFSSSSFSSIIGVAVAVTHEEDEEEEKEEEKAISIGSVSLLIPSMECSRIWETSSKGRSRRRKGLGEVVLGSEGVVEGEDVVVVVVVVLVVGDCVEEGIFKMSCWGAAVGEE